MVRPEVHDSNLPNVSSREVSWTAVIAGALVAIALSFLVHTFNAGIGLSAFTTSSGGMLALAAGAMLWLILTAIVTMFIAGWIAGRLARGVSANPFVGVLHGFLAWSLGLIVALVFATSVISGLASSDSKEINAVERLAQQAAISDRPHSLTPSERTQNVANTAGATALATFLVFGFGAIASGIGGYYGMKGKYIAGNKKW